MRRERCAQGLTQDKLAELAGISTRNLQKVEAGQLNILLTTTIRIQLALRCSWKRLMPSEKCVPRLYHNSCRITPWFRNRPMLHIYVISTHGWQPKISPPRHSRQVRPSVEATNCWGVKSPNPAASGRPLVVSARICPRSGCRRCWSSDQTCTKASAGRRPDDGRLVTAAL